MFIQEIVNVVAKVKSDSKEVGYLVEGHGFISSESMHKVAKVCNGIKSEYKLPAIEVQKIGENIYGISNENEYSIKAFDDLNKCQWMKSEYTKKNVDRMVGKKVADKYYAIMVCKYKADKKFIDTCLIPIANDLKSTGRYRMTLIETDGKRTYVFGGRVNADIFKTTPTYELLKKNHPEIRSLKAKFWVIEIGGNGNEEYVQDRLPKNLLRIFRIQQGLNGEIESISDGDTVDSFYEEIEL